MLENYINLLSAQSGKLQAEIDSAVANNSKRESLLQKYYSFSAKYGTLRDYYDRLFCMRKMVMSIMDEYRDTVISNLEQRVTSILGSIFPEEQFKVKITYKPCRGNYVSEVLIGKESIDGSVIWSKPRTANGGFMKQLISFSIIASMNILLHSNFLFMDEPFSSSDTVNVSKLKPVFDLMLEQHLQLMFIEHKQELYSDIDHKLIRLYKHRSAVVETEGYVEVVNMERVEADGEAQNIPTDEVYEELHLGTESGF